MGYVCHRLEMCKHVKTLALFRAGHLTSPRCLKGMYFPSFLSLLVTNPNHLADSFFSVSLGFGWITPLVLIEKC